MQTEYDIALESSRAASRAYHEACAAYRAGKIGDAEFLKARAAHVEAEKAFDIAYAAASAAA